MPHHIAVPGYGTVATELVKALGLDHKMVRGFAINSHVDSFVTIDVTMVAEPHDVAAIIEVVERYELRAMKPEGDGVTSEREPDPESEPTTQLTRCADLIIYNPMRRYPATLGDNIGQDGRDAFEVIFPGRDRPDVRIGDRMTFGMIEMVARTSPYSRYLDGSPAWAIEGDVIGH